MCNFPASELVRLRRQVAEQADLSADPAFVENSAAFVLGVDRLRIAHEELTDCNCWYKAVTDASKIEVMQ